MFIFNIVINLLKLKITMNIMEVTWKKNDDNNKGKK